MNILRIIVLLIFPLIGISQAPQKINFQSVLRNTNGEVVSNKAVSLKISILEVTITGSAVYIETHDKTTDAGGLISVKIGGGTVLSGVFGNINWGGSAHFIKLEADFSGGNSYVLLGTQELMSVPYALYASKTDTSALNLTSRFSTKLSGVDTNSLSARINAKSSLSDTSLLNLATRFSTKLSGADTVSLSARINAKSSLSDTSLLNLTSRFETKLNKSDTSSLSNRINAKLSKTDTSSLSERINSKLSSTVIPYAPIIQKGHIMYWNGSSWVLLYPGAAGQVLKMSSGNDPVPVWGTDATTSVPAFSPCGAPISDIDGNVYNTVLIGAQCWTKENLRVRRYNNGTAIPFDNTGGSGGNSSTWQNLTRGAHTIYAHDSTATTPSNLTKYGYLYNWYAAKGIYTTGTIVSTDTLNICPSGWHVPSDTEWTTLTTELGGESVAGGKMKSVGTAYWSSQSTGTDNSSGFSVLPGGFRLNGVSFYNIRLNAFFWSATEFDYNYAWFRDLNNINGIVYRESINKSLGASVRCLRD
ncbi:MAG: fibrobacter succinogenes major paralogous domain-containing protein [Bacteroidota bacterium]